MSYMWENITLFLSKVFFGICLIYCLSRCFFVFFLKDYPSSPIVPHKGKSLLSSTDFYSENFLDNKDIDLEALITSSLWELPANKSDLVEDSGAGSFDYSYLTYMKRMTKERHDKYSLFQEYIIDGIVWADATDSLVILKNKKSQRRLYLKEKAHLTDWFIASISPKKVLFKLLADSNQEYEMFLQETSLPEKNLKKG
ncbi:hypothetical protein AB834_02390 [PVC group bacterium (ex Bugula neritina AB1)]|nr:hypothetical protein AB834_02390 [PVC group bacterium (ex Bugula neritina AB1)]